MKKQERVHRPGKREGTIGESSAKANTEKQKKREEQRCREQVKMNLNHPKMNKIENKKSF